ncbi:hypothetical protein I4U23_019314 [Adineta vaga]|nr:hypothetical protein I4U23_019314 [Adineta vaga]
MASSTSRLNKELYSEITKLKVLSVNSDPKFTLETSPFKDDDDDDDDSSNAGATSGSSNDINITGLIYPTSDIYNGGAYRIEIKLIPTYPFDAPEVRFLTSIYHPNVDQDGKFCHELLKKKAKWLPTTSLVEVVKAVTEHIDKPDIDFSLSISVGREYMENRAEFNRKALEYVKTCYTTIVTICRNTCSYSYQSFKKILHFFPFYSII